MGDKYLPLPKWVHEQNKITPPPVLKPFDMKIGDTFRTTTENVKGGLFIVTDIHPYIFVGERNGYKESFSKIDYQTGRIKKVEVKS